MNQIDESKLVHILLQIGKELLLAGAEISRVEDTLIRIGTAFGATKVNVFVITSCIILTVTDENGDDFTNTLRIDKPAGINLTRLDKLNNVSRICCSEGMTLEELQSSVEEACLERTGFSANLRNYLGSAIVGFAFPVFFGGTILDGLVGIFAGMLINFLQTNTEKYSPNRVVFNLISGFITGTVICMLGNIYPVLHADKIMIGVIMLQIPGVAMTISFRDVIVGETISGTLRLIECITWATAIAVGYMLAITLVL